MGKKIYIDPKADEELKEFSGEVQQLFVGLIKDLEAEGRLSLPDAKKISEKFI